MEKQVIAIGNDHAGFRMKRHLIEFFKHGLNPAREVIDCGCDSSDSVDYPTYAAIVCNKILSGEATHGLLICGTGVGMSMAANRFAGIRAVVTQDIGVVKLAREHNNTNILCLGARVTPSVFQLQELIRTFLNTPFSLERRHMRRINMMEDMAAADQATADIPSPAVVIGSSVADFAALFKQTMDEVKDRSE